MLKKLIKTIYKFSQIFLCLFVFVGSSLCHSQISEASKIVTLGKPKHNRTNNIITERDGFLYTLGKDIINEEVQPDFKKLFLRKYDSQHLQLVQSWEFEYPQFKGALIRLNHLVSNDRGIFLFLEVFRKIKGEKQLYVERISFDGRRVSIDPLFIVPAKHAYSHKFIFSVSPDSSKTMVYVDVNNAKAKYRRPLIFVLEEDMTMFYQNTPDFSLEEGQVYKPLDLTVNNLGEVFVLGIRGDDALYDDFSFIGGDYSVSRIFRSEEIITLRLDYTQVYLHSAGLGNDVKNQLIIHGFYSNSKAEKIDGYLSMVLDNSNLNEVFLQKSVLPDSTLLRLYNQSNAVGSLESVDFFNFTDFQNTPSGMVAVAEKYNKVGKDYVDDVYLYQQDLVIIRLSKTAELESILPIDRNHLSKPYFNKSFVSLNGDAVQLLIYDHADNAQLRLEGKLVKSAVTVGTGTFHITLLRIGLNGEITYTPVTNRTNLGKLPLVFIDKSAQGKNGKVYSFMHSRGPMEVHLVEIDPSE